MATKYHKIIYFAVLISLGIFSSVFAGDSEVQFKEKSEKVESPATPDSAEQILKTDEPGEAKDESTLAQTGHPRALAQEASSAVLAQDPEILPLEIEKEDRILVLAPHPDDEILCCGGIIQKAVSMDVPVKIVFLTYGDSNQWSFMIYRKHPVFIPGAVERMGLVRYDEAVAAAQVLGLTNENLVFLGYPDYGTLRIWNSRWRGRKPLRSTLTHRRAVPYKNAFRPGALYKGEDLLQDLTAVINDFKPNKIFISHPLDHNGDHLSAYLFTKIALWDLKMESVQLFPYLIHYSKKWPAPKGLHPDKPLLPPEDLAKQIRWWSYYLTADEVEVKRHALKAHASQYKSNTKSLVSFIRANELFGDFPVIRLKRQDPSEFLLEPALKDTDIPEELTPEERKSFVGLEWRFVRLEGENLVLSIELSKPLTDDVHSSVYAFGYRSDRTFSEMPKMQIKLSANDYTVYDQAVSISEETISVDRKPNEIVIRIPLKILGDPDRILTSARTYLGTIPLDLISWRVLELY